MTGVLILVSVVVKNPLFNLFPLLIGLLRAMLIGCGDLAKHPVGKLRGARGQAPPFLPIDIAPSSPVDASGHPSGS